MSDPEVIARDEFFDSLLGDFLDESAQLLDRLNENLLQLDQWVRSLDDPASQRCDEDLINEMFRSAHSLKGLSAMLGLSDINNLTHRVENVFDAARKNELPITGDVVELVFQAVDRLGGLVEALKNPGAPAVECDSIVAQIADLLRSAGVERKQSSQADAERNLACLAAESPPAESAPPDSPAAPAESHAAEPGATPPVAPQPAAPAASAAPDAPPPAAEVDFFADLRDEQEVSPKYLSIFIDETELSLDQLTETLLATEAGWSHEAVEKILVLAHRIKGSAASLGLNRPAKLAHLMEDVLQDLAESRQPLQPKVADALLMCTDGLRQYVEGLRAGKASSSQFNHLAHELALARAAEHVATADENGGGVAAKTAAVLRAPEGERESIARLRAQVAAATHDPDATWIGLVRFQPGLALVGLKARLVYEKLSNLGEVCYFDPPAESLDELEKLDAVTFGLSTDKPIETIRRHLRIAGVAQLCMEPLAEAREPGRAVPADGPPAASREAAAAGAAPGVGPQPARIGGASAAEPRGEPGEVRAAPSGAGATARADAPKGRAAEVAARPAETLRVDIERLDQLMNLAGQLVINKARFSQIAERLKAAVAGKQSTAALENIAAALKKISDGADGARDDARAELATLRNQARWIQNELDAVRRDIECLVQMRGSVNDLCETIHQLERVSDEVQQSVMDTRMVPIGPLFARFKRVVRDITRGNGKLIELVINGEKTELDKRMIDELGDPLIHMVRNAADHGIEAPEAREAAGKPRHGTISLNAYHRGNSIIIEVSDDGKGLDAERIKRKAIDKGLISEADAEKMSRSQIYQLIWEPGLSTAEKVTEVSGRGMGMDIVKSKIEDLNGVVELDSEPGRGTTLTIKLPLTLAILPSLMVEIDGDVFAMPLEGVEEIVSVRRAELATVHGRWTARVRGRVISVVRLREVFSWSTGQGRGDSENSDETTLVVVGDQGREIGLAVDRVIGEEDVVIKSMAENYRNVAGIAGASILGDGRVSLILDLLALIEMASRRAGGAAVAAR